MILIFLLEVLQSFLGFLEDILPPDEQFHAKIFALALVHKRLFVGRPVILGFGQHFPPTPCFFCSWALRVTLLRGWLIYVHSPADNIGVRPLSWPDIDDNSMTCGEWRNPEARRRRFSGRRL